MDKRITPVIGQPRFLGIFPMGSQVKSHDEIMGAFMSVQTDLKTSLDHTNGKIEEMETVLNVAKSEKAKLTKSLEYFKGLFGE